MAWNIGANDVANAMGTSVGSKALTLKKAVLVAAVLEFGGAFFAGSRVSETIQHGIIAPEVFAAEPTTFILGMMSALLSTGLLLQLASYFGLPISTTHAIVGAVIGFGTIIGGIHAVHWHEVGFIALSWITSPILSGLVSYTLFFLLQRLIFETPNPLEAAQKLRPLLVFSCITAVSLSLVFQGLKQLDIHLSFAAAFSIACSLGGAASFGSYWLTKTNRAPLLSLSPLPSSLPIGSQTLNNHSNRLAPLHSDIEMIFIPLQIISACLVAFAHGANDVANAIGPVAAVVEALNTNTVGSHAQIPLWLLALGGSGIVLGLATWGWRVIETIGKKITELTPSRGFCAEFGAALTILLASQFGLPISTTHALIGAVFGVGLIEGLQALNLQTIKDIVISWVVTIPLCAALSVLVFYALHLFL